MVERRGWRCRVTSGRSTTLVASSRPPSPTSRMQASAGVRAKARKATAVATSKKLGSIPSLASSTSVEQRGERFVVDQPAGDPDALVEADEVRAGEDMDRVARRFERGAEEGAGRALAVGAGDVEDRRKLVLRAAEPVEQRARCARARAGRRPARASTSRSSCAWTPGCAERAKSAIRRPPSPPARDRRSSSASFSFSSPRGTTMSIMPCSSRYSARWKPSGSFSRMVCSITRWPAKPISAPGSASWTSPSIA